MQPSTRTALAIGVGVAAIATLTACGKAMDLAGPDPDAPDGDTSWRDELAEQLRSSKTVSVADAAQGYVRLFDESGDGVIDIARESGTEVGTKDDWDGSPTRTDLTARDMFEVADLLGTPDGSVDVDEVEDAIREFDQDGDGMLTERYGTHESEHMQLRRGIGVADADQAEQRAGEPLLEVSGVGNEPDKWPIPVLGAQILRRYDADGDGSVSIEDEATFSSTSGDEGDFSYDASVFLRRADTNDDEGVDLAEITAALRLHDVDDFERYTDRPDGFIDPSEMTGLPNVDNTWSRGNSWF